MDQSIMSEIEEVFRGKIFLTIADICGVLGCSENVVYNWMKRADPLRRPPRIKVGQEMKFPRGAFFQWLVKEQG
jgi:predicted DNA-binding transcriptional regulator AlpA